LKENPGVLEALIECASRLPEGTECRRSFHDAEKGKSDVTSASGEVGGGGNDDDVENRHDL